jgi:hypothetical protein
LSSEERSKAVSSLMFLKEKQDKSIKGRMCDDRRSNGRHGQNKNPYLPQWRWNRCSSQQSLQVTRDKTLDALISQGPSYMPTWTKISP